MQHLHQTQTAPIGSPGHSPHHTDTPRRLSARSSCQARIFHCPAHSRGDCHYHWVLKWSHQLKQCNKNRDSLPSHMCRNYSQNSIPQFRLSSFIAYICHFSCHKIHKALVLQTPTSREHRLTDIFADCVNTPNTVTTFSPLVNDEVLQIRPT